MSGELGGEHASSHLSLGLWTRSKLLANEVEIVIIELFLFLLVVVFAMFPLAPTLARSSVDVRSFARVLIVVFVYDEAFSDLQVSHQIRRARAR